mgnify:CR=1 FL=1
MMAINCSWRVAAHCGIVSKKAFLKEAKIVLNETIITFFSLKVTIFKFVSAVK